VEASGFKHPTLIQAQLIPRVLAGKDVIGQAKTGTGKTAAFGLPILCTADPDVAMQALILTPTRELAAQVAGEMEQLGRFTPIRTSCIIGGESMREQSRSLQKGGHIIVGTPGRVMDMQGRGQVHFDNVRYVVLDEVDRMLDIGFREDIRKILKSIKGDHQTVFVSATISDEIERLARSYMKPDVEKIMTTSGSLTVSLVDQKYLPVEPWDKPQLLLHLLTHTDPDLTVVFCRTKATVHRVSKYLRDKKINCREIHGDLSQNRRNSVMNTLRTGKLDVLVASDLAARGLDIDDISHVINYDLPDDPEVYIHRIGRTARAGRRGIAWSFVTPDQGQLLTEIEKIAGTMIEKLEYPDFKPGPLPEDVRVERERAAMRRADPMATLSSRSAPLMAPPAAAAAAAPGDTAGDQGYTAEELARMFPDGNIPKSLPRRTLGSRFRTRRSR
jgi:ATP-dependent RNA helicase DeaD